MPFLIDNKDETISSEDWVKSNCSKILATPKPNDSRFPSEALRARRKRWLGRFWVFRGVYTDQCWLVGGWWGRRSGGRHGGGVVELSWRKLANSSGMLFPAGFFWGEKKINFVIHRKRDAESATLGGNIPTNRGCRVAIITISEPTYLSKLQHLEILQTMRCSVALQYQKNRTQWSWPLAENIITLLFLLPLLIHEIILLKKSCSNVIALKKIWHLF
jgi:hypothetical protein